MEKQQALSYNDKTESSYPSAPGQTATVYQHQGIPTVTVAANVPHVIPTFGPIPQPTTCPHCHAQITTRVESEASMKTHLMAVFLCIMCCLPCIPYCMDSCQNRNHYCPSCSAFLGTYDSDNMRGRRYF